MTDLETLPSGHVLTDEDVAVAQLIDEFERSLKRPTADIVRRVASTPPDRVQGAVDAPRQAGQVVQAASVPDETSGEAETFIRSAGPHTAWVMPAVPASRKRPAWWATAFWPHRAQLLAAMVATLLIDVIVLLLTFVLLLPDQTRSVLTIMVPTMVILLAAMPFLTVDRDRLRARALLGSDLVQVAVHFGLSVPGRLHAESLARAQEIILTNAAVQRRLAPALLWALDFILLVVGALLGQQFARDFAPPDVGPEWEWATKAFAVLVPVATAAMIVFFVRFLARLDMSTLSLFTQLAARPELYEIYLPLHHDRFRRTFNDDLQHAVALASSPPDNLQAVEHFLPAARRSRTWQPDNLLDLSFTLSQLGIGLILGAVFQVFG